MPPPFLELERLTKRFGGLTAVNNVSFQISRDEVIGLIGPNGAGKTTLFNLICGNLRCTSGRVYFYGQEITEMPIHQRARLGLGRTFQQNSLFPDQRLSLFLVASLNETSNTHICPPKSPT
jgi:branched-chain amino acid transport system ATP-binding protein